MEKNIAPIIFNYENSCQLETCKSVGSSDRIFMFTISESFQISGFNIVIFVLSPDRSLFLLTFVLQALLGHTDTVTCLTASLAYHIIVSGSRDRTCIIWDLNKLSFLTQLRGHRAPVSALCINELTVRTKYCSPVCSGNSSKSQKSLNWRKTN